MASVGTSSKLDHMPCNNYIHDKKHKGIGFVLLWLWLVSPSMYYKDVFCGLCSGTFPTWSNQNYHHTPARLKEIMEFVCDDKVTDITSIELYLEYHNLSGCSPAFSMCHEFGEDYALSVPCESKTVAVGWFWAWWTLQGLCPICPTKMSPGLLKLIQTFRRLSVHTLVTLQSWKYFQ